ncbi:MAG: tetratricopeptide repeat protein [Bacteroidota bacterium]
MNKSEFITLIEHPENLEKVHVQALKGIIADFPYLQQAHSILTKALYSQKHYEFEKQLKSTALMVPDREVLYAYIHDIKAEKNAPAVSVLQEVNIPVITEEIAVIEVPAGELPTIEKDERASTVTETPKLIVEPDQELTFLEWLQRSKQPVLVIPENDSAKVEGTLQSLPNIEIADFIVDAKEEKDAKGNTAKPASNIHDFENILDRFIRENPSISRPKAEFYNPVNVAKQSVEEDEDLVTETLANIYYKQGHYKKAIRTYEKLCLIYPHKMAYFASLIQKIKTENKD